MTSPDKSLCFIFFFIRGILPLNVSYCNSSILVLIQSTLYLENSLFPFLFAVLHTEDWYQGSSQPFSLNNCSFFSLSSMSGFLELRLVSIALLKAVSIWLLLWTAESKWDEHFIWALSHAEKASSLSICFTVLLASAVPTLRPTTNPQFKGKAEISSL